MKKLIIYLLCCVVLVSMVGCGGNTAPPPTESPTTTVSETVITEPPLETIPPVTAVEPTGKDPVTTEREEQVTEPEPTEKPAPFDIDNWIAYARSYAENKGLVLSDTAVGIVGITLSAQAHTAFTLKEISKADLTAMQRIRTSPTCGSGQKLWATIATTFISATLKNE